MSQPLGSVIPFSQSNVISDPTSAGRLASPAWPTPSFPGNLTTTNRYRHIVFETDQNAGTLWCNMRRSNHPSFTPELLADLLHAQAEIKKGLTEDRVDGRSRFRTFVLASSTPGIFNLGGDLRLFASLITEQDRAGLTTYAHDCIDLVFGNIDGYGDGLLTVALVKGQALGGGFEAALSCHVIVAERSARFGLPEIMFNLFPGMGAYNFLCRKISPSAAERLIVSGQIYSAADLHEMGIVDVLAEDGAGELAVSKYIRDTERRAIAHRAIRTVRQQLHPVSRADLIRVTDLWVDTALSIGEEDLRRMRRLVAAQERRSTANPIVPCAAE